MDVNVFLHWHRINVSYWTLILICILILLLPRINNRLILVNWSYSLSMNSSRNEMVMMDLPFSVHGDLNLNYTFWPWDLNLDYSLRTRYLHIPFRALNLNNPFRTGNILINHFCRARYRYFY